MDKRQAIEWIESNVADDEPIFIMKATDNFALAAISTWLNRGVSACIPADKLSGAYCCMLDFIDWRRRNISKTKDPD